MVLTRRRSITVLNFGAHYSAAKNRSGLPDYTADINRLGARLRRLPSPHGLVVWRSTHHPHPGCELEPIPWRPENLRNRTANLWERCSSPRPPASCPKTDYNWELYSSYDRLARKALQPAGVRFLNVSYMSSLRPDAHSEYRFEHGKMPPDCSHFALPGVPDWWNAMLLWALAECEPGFEKINTCHATAKVMPSKNGFCGSQPNDKPAPASCGAAGFDAAKRGVLILQDCVAQCSACTACRFASFSQQVGGGDCSLYTSCDTNRLRVHRDYKTVDSRAPPLPASEARARSTAQGTRVISKHPR